MRSVFSLILLLLVQFAFAQVTFVIKDLPEYHNFENDIYISGDFEGWTGGNETYKLTKADKQYSITLPKETCDIIFKFTMGSWDTEELDVTGNKVENRGYKCNTKSETVFISIENWGPMDAVEPSTAQSNVQLLSEAFEMPQLDRDRKIWVYLPPNYDASKDKYPVLYMHDAQNLFDAKTAYAGEWNVDEILNAIFYETGFEMIVVGIENGGDKRLNEYSPWANPKYGQAEGEAYADFIVNNLKPHVDQTYRTLSDVKNTAIMGSSMGGLISFYTALKYPNVFGKAGVLSPSFWYSNSSYEFAEEYSKLGDTKMYFLAGDNESETMVSNMQKMTRLMLASGFKSENIQKKIVEGGQHNEKLWRDNFEETIQWLFPEAKNERTFKGVEETGFGIEIEVSDGKYLIQFFSPKISETSFLPTGEAYTYKSHAVVAFTNNRKYLNSAHGPIMLEDKIVKSIVDKRNYAYIKTDGIQIEIQKKPFKISYSYKGKPITSEGKGYHKTEYGEAIQMNLTKDEVLYGGGARALGMNRRGNRLQLYNKAHYGYETESELMNFTLPIVVSSNQYMIHFDNAPIGYLDLDSKADNTLTYETLSGRKTYQVIVGDSWEDLISNYTTLTGKQPLPPRWAFGNFSSRFGYHSQAETEQTIDKFKAEEIPVDAVIIDIYWFGKKMKGTMGNLEFHKDSFPNPKQMIKGFRDQGVKTVLVTEPFVLSTSKRWDEVVEKDVLAKDSVGNPFRYDFYFGNTGLIDIYNRNGKSWFWDRYKELADLGVQGFWGDLGEPEVHPSALIHATGTADEVHNTYGHDWARLLYEGYKEHFPNQRPFILMRAGYSGSQRFGLIPWSGDVNRTWGGLQSQMEIALQMGMQGIGYMHSDLGGFAGANLDDELYTRWLQYGVFQPIYRPHAQEEVPSEPVFRESKTKQLAKQSIELRYKLLPYNYTLAFENNQTGKPLMRPLFFEDASTEQLTNASTYLWGNDILVTPIVNPGIKEKAVYFPQDNVWFDFYMDAKIQGGQTQSVATKADYIPTYVRAGAFIPLATLVQTTDDYNLDAFELHYYHDASVVESKRNLYNDDGVTREAFEKGAYELLEFESDFSKNELQIEFQSQLGQHYVASKKAITLVIHNVDGAPQQVKIGRKKVRSQYNASEKILSIPVSWNTKNEIEINIKLKK